MNYQDNWAVTSCSLQDAGGGLDGTLRFLFEVIVLSRCIPAISTYGDG